MDISDDEEDSSLDLNSDTDRSLSPELTSERHFDFENSGLGDSVAQSSSNTTAINGFSLDTLLAEKQETEVKNMELLTMRNQLKEDIEQGGIMTIMSKESTNLDKNVLMPDDHAKKLERLQVVESTISEIHPGEDIFDSRLFLRVFDENIRPVDCGYVAGNSLIDNQISNYHSELLVDFITSGILQMCIHKISTPQAICKWLFYVMSVHQNDMVIHACHKALQEIIHAQIVDSPEGKTWCPSCLDIFSIFVNYGAPKDVLLLQQSYIKPAQIDMALEPMGSSRRNNNNFKYLIKRDNLLHVLETLSFALQGRPYLEKEEIELMIQILMKAALDKNFTNNKCHYEFQVAISSALECIKESFFNVVASELCSSISQMTRHHHNMVYLVQLLPPGKRGHYIQQRLASMFLHHELLGKPMEECLEHIHLNGLFIYVSKLKELIKNLELYKLSSCIVLMDLVVGSETHSISEKVHLTRLSDMINELKGNLRDSVQMLDKTKVKSLMVRISSKWSLMIATMASTQRTLFPWTRNASPLAMKVEKLKDRIDLDSDEEMESKALPISFKKHLLNTPVKTENLLTCEDAKTSENEPECIILDADDELPEL